MTVVGAERPTTAAASGRIIGVDTARGLALLGMMAAHLLPRYAFGEPTTTALLVDGRASALFAVLAGTALALADGGNRPPPLPFPTMLARVATRALVIMLLGFVLAGVEPRAAVILQYYGLLFLLAAPLLRLPVRVLAPLALAWLLLVPVATHWLRATWSLSGPGPQVDLGLLLADPGGSLVTLLLSGYYPVLPWLGYLLVGAVVGRLALRTTRVAVGLCGVGLALALLAPTVSAILLRSGGNAALLMAPDVVSGRLPEGPLFGTTPTTTWWWLAIDTPHSGTGLDLLATTGSALLVLGVCLLLTRTVVRPLLAPVTAAGSMPLTLYLGHVGVLALPAPPFSATGTWLLHAAGALALAWAWRAWFRRGPVEAVLGRFVDAVAGPAQPPESSDRDSRTA